MVWVDKTLYWAWKADGSPTEKAPTKKTIVYIKTFPHTCQAALVMEQDELNKKAWAIQVMNPRKDFDYLLNGNWRCKWSYIKIKYRLFAKRLLMAWYLVPVRRSK